MRKVVGGARRASEARSNGFTIIEVMFFLAISSALLIALLSTVGFTISRQRFTDSGLSLQSFFQSQYNETINVVNDRSAVDNGSAGVCSQPSGGVSLIAGQSQCLVLGKVIDMTKGSSTITVHTVIGTEPATDTGLSGSKLLASYNPTIDASSSSSYDIAWAATVTSVKPTDNTRLLLLRSPDSGLILHFSGTPSDSLKNIVLNSNPRDTYSLCIQSGDILNTGGLAAVTLSPLASTESVNTAFDMTAEQRNTLC